MLAPEPDEHLMARIMHGDRQAFETLVRRHGPGILTLLRRMTGNRHRAEELFQDTFLAVWQKCDQFRPGLTFRPWLYTIAVNRCRAEFRSQRTPTVPLNEEAVADAVSPVDAVVARETASQVLQAVSALPEQQRLVVSLRVWQGLSYAEIAQTIGLHEGTVRSHMHHALAALRRTLKDEPGA